MVCFEAVFPELARELVHAGANLLINQTNDSWFGTTRRTRQHLMHAVLRSANQIDYPMARAATPESLLVDRRGKIVAEQPLMEPGC
ncbi:MAG: nitrilase-related carbon-nitrogen hydrolase [Acidobacteriota bacterium]